jgi:tetratricopeptide (TPR) repeat protein
MASLIPGYEYDIFISYRQKDNKGDRWVSEFVESLKTELESTFKEEVNVYFDINQHDGLLETHDVDASLKSKLKCLVFIPVISRTYCDTKSFAWEHEFKAFIEQSSNDRYGLRVTLPNGNVVNRVLPVRIHDLDITDIKLCESALGGMMRGIDFVYKATGVNRPLRPVEEHPHDNINKTYYRDQINKVANSIKDIVKGLTYLDQDVFPVPDKKEQRKVYSSGRKFFSNRKLRWTLLLTFVFVCFLGIYIYVRLHQHNINEKTIAIIPMTNPQNDPELGKYAIGSMDAITSKLQEISSLTVRSGLSSLKYLETKKSPAELGKELKCNFLVIINISRLTNNMTMWVGLTKTKNNRQLWARPFDVNENQLMPLFTEIVQTMAGKLNIVLTNQEIINIEKDLTQKPDAYLNYLMASAGLILAMGNKFPDSTNFRSVINFYDKAIEADPEFAMAYARRAIALSWGFHSNELDSTSIEKCWSDIRNASRINKNLTAILIAQGFYYYYCKTDYANALINFNNASLVDPENYQPFFYMAMVYRAMGEWQKAHSFLNRVIAIEPQPQDPLVLTNIGLTFDYFHDFDSAILYHEKAINVNPKFQASYVNEFNTLLLKYGNTDKAHSLLDFMNRQFHEEMQENRILLDIYDGKYLDALTKTKNARPEDFTLKGDRFLNLAKISSLMNDQKNAVNYYDSLITELNQALKSDPNNAGLHGYLGLAYAGKGKIIEAETEGKKAVQLAETKKNPMIQIDMIINLAQIYTKLGLFDKAIENIEYSLKNPSLFSSKMLRLDPIWKPLMDRKELKTLISKYDHK